MKFRIYLSFILYTYKLTNQLFKKNGLKIQTPCLPKNLNGQQVY